MGSRFIFHSRRDKSLSPAHIIDHPDLGSPAVLSKGENAVIHDDLGKTIVSVLGGLGLDERTSGGWITIIKWLTSHQRWFVEKRAYQVLESLLKDNDVQQFLQINRYNDILWFNGEAFDDLLWWLMLVAEVEMSSDLKRPTPQAAKDMEDCNGTIEKLKEATKTSGYQVEKLLAAAK